MIFAALFAAGCASGRSAPATAPSLASGTVGLTILVSTSARGGEAASPDRLGDEVGRAAYEFAVAGVDLSVASIEFVPLTEADPRTARGRRKLAARAAEGTVPVVYVHHAGRNTRGEWFPRTGVIVIDRDASPTTLTHELGHAFGLPHEGDPNNIMCSCDRQGRPTFSSGQRQRLAAAHFVGVRRAADRGGR